MSHTKAARAERRLVPIPDARHYLGGISHETIYRLIRAGQLGVIKVGRRTFVDQSELDRFIDERASAS